MFRVRWVRAVIAGSDLQNSSKFFPPNGLLCNYRLRWVSCVRAGRARDSYLRNLSDKEFPGRTSFS